MSYRFQNGKIFTNAVEYSVAYHCNLRCFSCSHMSPFIDKKLPSIESFQSDISKLNTALHAKELRLLGGEPLLNPEILSFIKIGKLIGIADVVKVVTNGVLLHKMKAEFWENVDFVEVTRYPEVQLKNASIQAFQKIARESGTRLKFYQNPIFRTTIVTQPHPRDWITDMIFKTCDNVHRLHCHMVHEGRIYKCAVSPFLSEYLSKIGMSGYDSGTEGIHIHNTENLYQDLKAFFMDQRTLESCRYCLGYLGKKVTHHQMKFENKNKFGYPKIIRSTHLDRFKFLRLFSLNVLSRLFRR